MKDINAQCAERKAQRAAGKVRCKRREGLSDEARRRQFTPLERYNPKFDGTRRGVPNGIPADRREMLRAAMGHIAPAKRKKNKRGVAMAWRRQRNM